MSVESYPACTIAVVETAIIAACSGAVGAARNGPTVTGNGFAPASPPSLTKLWNIHVFRAEQ
jgi:hypothetical protein